MVVAVVVKDTEHMAKSAISMRQPSNGYAGMHTLNKNKKMFSQHPSYASAPTKLSRGHSLMSVLPVANAKLATHPASIGACVNGPANETKKSPLASVASELVHQHREEEQHASERLQREKEETRRKRGEHQREHDVGV